MFDRDGVKLKYVLQKRRIILLSFFLLITNNLDFVFQKSYLLIKVKKDKSGIRSIRFVLSHFVSR